MRRRAERRRGALPGLSLAELALVIPVLCFVIYGTLGVGRVIRAELAVSNLAADCARAAVAGDARDAAALGVAAARGGARGYGLDPATLAVEVDPGGFVVGGHLRCAVATRAALDDLPLLEWADVGVAATRVERIDPYRDRDRLR